MFSELCIENDSYVISRDFSETEAPINPLLFLFPENYFNLPMNDLNAVKSRLSTYLLVLNIFEDALECFIQKKYRSFDALVGNNSCYLVAYIVHLIAEKQNRNEKIYKECTGLVEKIKNVKDLIKRKYNQIEEVKDVEEFLSFIEKNNIEIECRIDFIYLCLAFGCALVQEQSINEYKEIHYSKIVERYQKKVEIKLKNKSIINIIKHWQKKISQINVATIQEHVKYIAEDEREWANYLFGSYVLKDGRGRLCTPSLYAQRVIYNLLLAIPNSLIGFQTNIIEQPKQYSGRFTLYYEVSTKGTLELIAKENVPQNRSIYMFAGCRYVSINSAKEIYLTKTEKIFTTRNVKDLIFAHEITYPQYPKSLKTPNIQPSELSITQEISRLRRFQGFSLEDPSDVCLVHIFTDNTSDQLLSFNDPPLFLPRLDCIDLG